jgi:hypothetical protein
MVTKSEIKDFKLANKSKGKLLQKRYINLSNKNQFYISQGNEIYKVEMEVDKNNNVKSMVLYNGSDNVVKHIKQNNVTCIVTNIGVVTMVVNKSIMYFSKPNSVSIYA